MVTKSDYMKYRGKCKEMSEDAILKDPSLILVRGYYHCPLDGKQEHWWTKTEFGEIFDPTVRQFKTNGAGAEYEEFNGECECEHCGITIKEENIIMQGRFPVCSGSCAMRLVGL